MKTRSAALFAALSSAAWLGTAACGDDQLFEEPRASATPDASFVPQDGAAPDADPGPDAEPRPTPPRVLVAFNGATDSELVAVDLPKGTVAGRLRFDGRLGTATRSGDQLFLLAQAADRVGKLAMSQPWSISRSWSVASPATFDGGAASAQPVAAVVGAGTKTYVALYERSAIAVLTDGPEPDGGAPARLIDLTPYVGLDDLDGSLEPTAAVYDAPSRRVYVVLGRIDRTRVSGDGFTMLCNADSSLLVAIDTTSDQLVPLGGTGPLGAIELAGKNPVVGAKPILLRDGNASWLWVLQGGCNADAGGGVAGGLERRQIDKVTLATGAVERAVDLVSKGFPLQLVAAGALEAVVGFYGEAYRWTVGASSLGSLVPNAPDSFTYDGEGHLVGVRTPFVDGGAGPTQLVRVPLASTDAGGPEILLERITELAAPVFPGGVELVPAQP